MDRRAWPASLVAAVLLLIAATFSPNDRAGAVVGDVASTAPPLPTELRVTDIVTAAVPRTGGVGLVRANVVNAATASDAMNVLVTYVLPAGVTGADVPGATPGCTAAATQVTCPVGSVLAGATVPVAVGVRVQPGDAAQLEGVFLSPRSDQWDPGAGEIAFRWWNHEAYVQGLSLQGCWPISSSSPNMDLGVPPSPTGLCDGVVDREALAPDGAMVLDAFSAPFSELVTRSWEWRTRIHVATAGDYRVCLGTLDDGGYVAMAPAGSVLDTADVILDSTSFNAGPPEQVVRTLPANSDHDLLIRVSNRGPAGIDNGGMQQGGWSYVGLVPAASACAPAAAEALGTGPAALRLESPAAIDVLPAATVRTTGTVTGPGRQWSQARVVNDGPDATTVTATATGELVPMTPREVLAGGDTVFATFLGPGATAQPWTISTIGTVAPQ